MQLSNGEEVAFYASYSLHFAYLLSPAAKFSLLPVLPCKAYSTSDKALTKTLSNESVLETESHRTHANPWVLLRVLYS